MHDIDRTTTEFEREADSFETDEFEFEDEFEFGGTEEVEEVDGESPFDEVEEIELATELLSIQSEEELDQFLGKVFKKVWRGVRKVGSAVGKIAKPLGGILKGIAKKALPMVGGALGSFIPIPGVGTAVGTALGGALSKALETEFEGLNPEDREFEMARRFVRVAGAAAQQAAGAQSADNLTEVARQAVVTAAKQHVSGLNGDIAKMGSNGAKNGAAASGGATQQRRTSRTGRWIRRGRRIVLLGV